MTPNSAHSRSDAALLDLIEALRQEEYSFTCVTPATHARVIERTAETISLRDVFGWSRPFGTEDLPANIFAAALNADALEACGDRWRSKVRVSSLGNRLVLHSAYPTSAADAVFFGPDTYRYVSLIRRELPACPAPRRIVDVGAGTGAGAIAASELAPAARLTLTDTNPAALRLASINLAFAGLEAELVEGSGLDRVSDDIDLVIANPPFLMDEAERAYRSGGDMHGARMSLDWALAGAKRLGPGGRMILYTGVAVVDGQDGLLHALERELPGIGCSLRYEEIDPDIFGEELCRPAYRHVERIAAVGAVIEKSA
jgi:SAM-dependent methyltransferase